MYPGKFPFKLSFIQNLMTLVHGDAKLDNFLFKRQGQSAEDKYTAMIIDWQVWFGLVWFGS